MRKQMTHGSTHGRLDDLRRFYASLERLEQQCGERRFLSPCDGRMEWPQRGVYFFMENGEKRTDTGKGLRVVRIGTHALTASSKTTLWKRLSQHRGQETSGRGNHRGSIFRLLVGSTLVNAASGSCPTWGVGNNAPPDVRNSEAAFEQTTSKLIRAMPFLWLPVDDPPGRESLRGRVERNSIALLGNLGKAPLDPASAGWRGRACGRGRGRVRTQGSGTRTMWTRTTTRRSWTCWTI